MPPHRGQSVVLECKGLTPSEGDQAPQFDCRREDGMDGVLALCSTYSGLQR
jgi:hypothetical protein